MPKGYCWVCHRFFDVTRYGLLYYHSKNGANCPGSRTKPTYYTNDFMPMESKFKIKSPANQIIELLAGMELKGFEAIDIIQMVVKRIR